MNPVQAMKVMSKDRINILGISAFYHDAAAVLVSDGEIIAAAQEERFTRKKHDPSFPVKSIEYCLREGSIDIGDIDLVAFYDKLFAEKYIRRILGYKGAVVFPEHHHSHAASAFYPSPFDEAAILTVDGAGKWITATFGKGKRNKIELSHEIRSPHSLGLLYSAFTHYCGFEVNSGEYKLMGLASYGEPRYVGLILESLVNLKKDGSLRLNLKYFNYRAGSLATNDRFHSLFGGRPRDPGSRLEQKHMDLARSVQLVTEMAILNMARHVYIETGMDSLCLAGDVALNCAANGRILREGPFKNIWIQPASSDAGGALGAALIGWHEYMGKGRKTHGNRDSQKASLLGPSFSDEKIKTYLIENDIPYEKLDREDLNKTVSDLLAEENVIGWFQGRMEFGPRALGSRSILADPRSGKMQSIMNTKIKFRESFRPFAPSVILERAGEYFDLDRESPYMLLVSPVKDDRREGPGAKRSGVPAITHVDHSARVQTVKREDNPPYYDMINKFYEDHGCSLVVNTSFNAGEEPIVCTPDDAYRCFMKTDMDYLVMGSFLIDKTKQGPRGLQPGPANEFRSDKQPVTGAVFAPAYCALLRPAGLLMKIFRNALSGRARGRNAETYWVNRRNAAATKKSLEKQF